MRTSLRALIVATFAVLAFVAVQQSAAAEMSVGVVPPDLTGVRAGEIYTATVTITAGSDDVSTTSSGEIALGSIMQDFPVTSVDSGEAVELQIAFTATNDTVLQCQRDGSVPLVWFVHLNNSESGSLVTNFSDSIAVPCSLPPNIPISLIAPTANPVCGESNDDIPLPDQPMGIVVSNNTGWQGPYRTIGYSALPGYVIVGPSAFQFVDAGDCVVLIPAPTHTEACGPKNDTITDNYDGTGVRLVDSGWVDNTHTRTFTYVAESGYRIDGQTTFSFTDTNRSCLITVSVIPPTQSQVCGDNNDTINVSEQPTGILIDDEGTWVDNSRTISYVADTGYIIEGDSEYTFADAGIICLTPVTVVPPTHVKQCGEINDTVTLHPQPEGIRLLSDSVWSTPTRYVTYEAEAGFVIEGEYTFIIEDSGKCLFYFSVPSQQQVCGPNNDNLDIIPSTSPEILTIHDTLWQNGIRTVTYELNEHYKADSPTVFEFEDANIECSPPVSPVPPIHTALCGPDNDIVEIPPQPAGVTTFVPGWYQGEYFMSFILTGGAEFVEGTQTFYEFTEDDRPCGEVQPIAPEYLAVCGMDNDIVTLPDQVPGVLVSTDTGWLNNEYTIEFAPLFGDTFPDGTQTEYTFIEDTTPCETEVAPIPPAQTAVCGPNNDLVITPVQPKGIEAESDVEWIDGEWTVTFSAADGYTMPEGTQSTYDMVDENTACESITPEPSPSPSPGVTPSPTPAETATPAPTPTEASTPTPSSEPIPAPHQQVTVTVQMPGDASAEGAPWALYAPVASQVAAGPFAEGVVGANNSFVLPELPMGTYRLIMNVPGYEPLDSIIAIEIDTTEVSVQIMAIQAPPTIAPAGTAIPATESTVALMPTEGAAGSSTSPVTSLPQTGSGVGSELPLVALVIAAGVLTLLWLGAERRQSRR